MLRLVRFWFEFDQSEVKNTALCLGCGITAWTHDDAINVLKSTLFKNQSIPKIKSVIENVDITTIDANHVRPNIVKPVNVRGIWYPQF